MMLMFLEILVFFFLMFFSVIQQPLGIGVVLLFYCFFISVYVFSFFSSWFSLSLFLIYIGGMLVLFGYVLVLIPNFMFYFNLYYFFFFFFFFFFFPWGEISISIVDFSFSFFGYMNLVIYLSLAVFLFVGLVVVAKICFFQVGSLRPFFFYYV